LKATAKDLRFHSKQLLEVVQRGEEVIITYRGKPCAKLVPYSKTEEPIEDELFGIWKDYDEIKNPSVYTRTLRKGRF
jgi:prevent-host-death family protein